MKKIFTFLLCLTVACSSQAQFGKLKSLISKDSSSGNITDKLKNLQGGGNSLSSEEITGGLKEALSTGVVNSTKLLSKPDGFFGNELLRIAMPEEAKSAENTLRKVGMSSLVDKAILSMNRAAEDAAGNVASVFLDAIKGMSVNDGLKILKGGDFAATDYLRVTTTGILTERMRPVIDQSLQKVNATQYWNTVFTSYNKVSGKTVETDLVAYVTASALKGLFHTIGLEEQKIRKDPAAQVTELMKKVFGNK